MPYDRPAQPSAGPSRSRLIYRLRREAYRCDVPAAAEVPAKEPREDNALAEERDRLKDSLLRVRADMENYRRRAEREREEMRSQCGREVLLAMLPVLDNFERAIEASRGAADAATVLTGVEMIRDQMRQTLLSQGLEPVEALGRKFDPTYHEAIGVEERDDVEDGHVIDVLQEGFVMGQRLLRPAMVRVAKKKS